VDQSAERDENEAVDRVLELISRADTGAPLVKRMNGVNVIDFSDVLPLYSNVPPHRKALLLLFLLALKDHATEVRFEHWATEPDGYRLSLYYEVDGQIHELVPPPEHLAETIIREIKAVAGFGSTRRRFADLLRRLASTLGTQPGQLSLATFQIVGGNDKIDISAQAYSSEMGERVVQRLANCPMSLSERAQHAFREIFDQK
jgi:hypothetical protein